MPSRVKKSLGVPKDVTSLEVARGVQKRLEVSVNVNGFQRYLVSRSL